MTSDESAAPTEPARHWFAPTVSLSVMIIGGTAASVLYGPLELFAVGVVSLAIMVSGFYPEIREGLDAC